MKYTITSLIFFLCFESYLFYQWPANIKRCSLSNTTYPFNKCLLDVTRATAPLLVRGQKEWGLPSLDPYRMQSEMFLTNNIPPVSLNFRVSNGTVLGASKVNVRKARYNNKTSTFYFDAVHKKLTISGNYILQGTLYSLDLNSKGIFKLEGFDCAQEFTAKLNPTKKKGYVAPKFTYKLNKMSKMTAWFRDANLPPFIEEALTEVVNENWAAVSSSLIPSLQKGMERHFTQYLGPLFRRFPLADIILD